MHDVVSDFNSKFSNSEIHTIISHDCLKSISVLNKEGYIELPHYLSDNYNEIKKSVEHCKNYYTILRYFDLDEVIKFICYVNENKFYSKSRWAIENNISEIKYISMINIKKYYLSLLGNITPSSWKSIYNHFINERECIYKSNIYITTKDAYTLTDGPTIFLADDVAKIAKFCIQTAKIPDMVMQDIRKTIAINNSINEKVETMESELEDHLSKINDKDKKDGNVRIDDSAKEMMRKISDMSSNIKSTALHDMFIPNRQSHMDKWASKVPKNQLKTVYTSDVSEKYVEEIMQLTDIDDMWKILLLMGIGAFTNHKSIAYNEIMKKLAEEQKLYLIIASTDYVYGTNYQFCHSYICKDLGSMTQEKAIQAMGRVGRNKIQQHYTIRLRDDCLVEKLFMEEKNKPEIINMNRLLNSGAEMIDMMGL